MNSPYNIILLDHTHLDQSVALHQSVIDSLPDTHKHFMLPKTKDYFANHIAHGSPNALIGIFDGDRLIAQALIHNPTADHPGTGMVDMKPVAAPEQVSVLQSVSVCPDYRGKGLMNMMVNAWINLVQAQGRTHLLSEIAVENTASWRAFLTAGMAITSIGIDPADGAVVYNAHGKIGSLSQEFNRAAATCDVRDIKSQFAYLNKGYAITGFDKNTGKMLLSGPK